jgi:hypothetical protein
MIMPPRDPKLCPALERALPRDSPGRDPGRRDGLNLPWDLVFGDHEWHRVRARAWWTDRLGREVVEIEWHADGSTWGESYIVDRSRMREV